MNDKTYSINGEDNWTDDIDYIKDTLEEYPELDYIYEGEKELYTHKDFLCIPNIICDMQEYAYEEAPEWSDGYLEDLTSKDKEELKYIILNYLEANVSQPTFYRVKNIKEIIINDL